ncbi:MAG: hypothetical protein LBM75_05075, partial [Myxococcales bacterium]|nr:hypothetical protein [Myxococcales bacterium]
HTFASVGFDAGELGRRRYETAALFWSNQPLPKIEAKPAFSVFYLSAKILRAARLPLPKHLRIVSTFESKMPSLNASLLQSGDGRWLAGPSAVDASSTEGAIIEALSLLAYDRLMGERLSERE